METGFAKKNFELAWKNLIFSSAKYKDKKLTTKKTYALSPQINSDWE